MTRSIRHEIICLAVSWGVSCASANPVTRPSHPVEAAKPSPPAIALAKEPLDLGEAVLPPASLTAEDGTELRLVAFDARATIADPLATTELRLTFHNDTARSLDAALRVSLPEGASVRRVAIRKPTPAAAVPSSAPVDAWNEAVLDDRGHVRATYDELLAARTSADLFEDGTAAPLSIALDPVAPGVDVDVTVAYDETLTGAYRLRALGLPKLGSFKARIDLAGASSPLSDIALHDEAPSGDLVVPEARFHPPSGSGAMGVGADGVIAVRAAIAGPSSSDALVSPIFLCDTSASRALDLAKEVSTLDGIVHALAPETEISVAAFDQTVAPIYQGPAGGIDAKALTALRSRRGLGASDLEGALAWAGRIALSNAGLHHRLVVLTDGVVNAGEGSASEISRLARDLGSRGIDRADVIAVGGGRDERILAALTHDPDLPWRGVVVDMDRGVDEIARRLTHTVLPPIAIAVDGAAPVSPRRVEGAQNGDEVVVLAEVNPSPPPLVHVGTASVRPVIRSGPEGLVDRRVAAARIETLQTQRELAAADRRAAIVAASKKHGIASSLVPFAFHAAPLAKTSVGRSVLLAEAFRASDVDLVDAPPPAPSDGNAAFDPLDASLKAPRADVVTPKEPSAAPPAEEPEALPVATPAEPPGRLPAEVIQRVVRLNHGRFRACYQKAIAQKPKLAGRVVVSFVIDASGSVPRAEDGGSDVDSPSLRECVQKAFMALSFPAPPAGEIVVKYPLVFAVDDRPPPPTRAAAVKYAAPPVPPQEPEPHFDAPYAGHYAAVMAKIAAHDADGALTDARQWQARAPNDLLGYLALGEAAEASGESELAARAYGSILELWGYRADLARMTGERLERIGTDPALHVARDAFARARDERPDHPTGQRLLAFAEYRLGRPEEAFRVLERTLNDNYQSSQFVGARALLGQDLGLLGAAWARSSPERRGEIERRTVTAGGRLQKEPSLRATLLWETNTTDVVLHVGDGTGDHVSRKKHVLSSGGELSTDIVDGYGPELFSVGGLPAKRSYPFSLAVAYPAHGPLGFVAGTVSIVEHDGKGHLRFDDRPFVVMNGHGGIELGDIVSPTIP